MKESMRRRISIPVSERLYQRFNSLIPWGERRSVVTILLEQLCEVVEKRGGDCLASLYLGKIRIGDSNEELSADDLKRAVQIAFRHKEASDDSEE